MRARELRALWTKATSKEEVQAAYVAIAAAFGRLPHNASDKFAGPQMMGLLTNGVERPVDNTKDGDRGVIAFIANHEARA